MNERKELGKITSARIGEEDGRMGIWFSLGGDGWVVGDTTHWWWSESIEVTSTTQWTEADRNEAKADAMTFLGVILKKAKVRYLDDLKGKPIEVTFNGNLLKSWRILTEVL